MLLSLIVVSAFAQDAASGFDAHGFVLHAHDGDVRDPLTLDRPGAFSGGDFWFAGIAEYADRPLVQVIAPSFGESEPVENVMLDRLIALNTNIGVAVHDRVRLDATAPVYFTSIGPDGEWRDPVIGDVRASTMVSIVRPLHIQGGGGPGLGVSGHVDIPTGAPETYLGQPGVAGGFAVSGTFEGPWYTLTGELGGQINPTIDLENLTNADQFVSGLALNVLPHERTGITAEAHLFAPLSKSDIPGTAVPAEGILSLRHRTKDGVSFTFGGAAGITEGASAARYRAFLGIGYGKVKPPRPPDSDALADIVVKDKCPDGIETKNGWKDGDGCPDELGAVSVRVTFKGEDFDEAELAVKGPEGRKTYRSSEHPSYKAVPGAKFEAEASAKALCLTGSASGAAGEAESEIVVELKQVLDTWAQVEVYDPAGNPLANPLVRWTTTTPTCMSEPSATTTPAAHVTYTPMGVGRHHVIVEVPGYKPYEQDVDVPGGGAQVRVLLEPSRVVLEKTRIAILDKVFFEFNKAVIKPESFGLLDDVAAVINAHEDVGRVQVEGHTDDKGNDAYNLKLSQARAESVRAYLISKGVPPERLLAVGFGETKPIETNLTEAGRGNNRRVEFNLIDQAADAAPSGGTP
ncbi:MAG: OmpA family protein [Myxococcota bacterium]